MDDQDFAFRPGHTELKEFAMFGSANPYGGWTTGQPSVALSYQADQAATSLLLAAIDARTGTPCIPRDALAAGLAAATLAELLLAGEIRVMAGQVLLTSAGLVPTEDHLHCYELMAIGDEARNGECHRLAVWIEYLAATVTGRVLSRLGRPFVGHQLNSNLWPIIGLDSTKVMWAGDRLRLITGATTGGHQGVTSRHDAVVVMLADVIGLLAKLSTLCDREGKHAMAATTAAIPSQFASAMPWLAPLADAAATRRARRAVGPR